MYPIMRLLRTLQWDHRYSVPKYNLTWMNLISCTAWNTINTRNSLNIVSNDCKATINDTHTYTYSSMWRGIVRENAIYKWGYINEVTQTNILKYGLKTVEALDHFHVFFWAADTTACANQDMTRTLMIVMMLTSMKRSFFIDKMYSFP